MSDSSTNLSLFKPRSTLGEKYCYPYFRDNNTEFQVFRPDHTMAEPKILNQICPTSMPMSSHSPKKRATFPSLSLVQHTDIQTHPHKHTHTRTHTHNLKERKLEMQTLKSLKFTIILDPCTFFILSEFLILYLPSAIARSSFHDHLTNKLPAPVFVQALGSTLGYLSLSHCLPSPSDLFIAISLWTAPLRVNPFSVAASWLLC